MLESEIEKKLVREIRKMGGMAYKFVSSGKPKPAEAARHSP